MAKKHLYQHTYKHKFLKYGFSEKTYKNISWALHSVYGSLGQLIFEKKNKLNWHLTSMHPNFVNKPLSHWSDEEGARRMKLDALSNIAIYSLKKTSLASFKAAWKTV
jgi:hypothetical protein